MLQICGPWLGFGPETRAPANKSAVNDRFWQTKSELIGQNPSSRVCIRGRIMRIRVRIMCAHHAGDSDLTWKFLEKNFNSGSIF